MALLIRRHWSFLTGAEVPDSIVDDFDMVTHAKSWLELGLEKMPNILGVTKCFGAKKILGPQKKICGSKKMFG